MTKVILISNDKQLKKAFTPISKTKKYRFEHLNWEKWKIHTNESNNRLFYFDIADLSDRELKNHLTEAQQLHSPWGIIDNDGRIEDIACLFHDGCCDYVCSEQVGTVKLRRVRRVLDFHSRRRGDDQKQLQQKHSEGLYSAPPALDWESVVPGKEYTFCFMYIELLPSKEWSRKAGDSHQEQMQTAFHDLIESHIEAYNGRIWMWGEWGGLVLFPFDGTRTDVVVLATRLLLNRVILSIEGGPFQTLINYKLALHIGSTVYKERGETGKIVSDDVNFIFHLGGKCAQPNRLFLTSEVSQLIDSDLRTLLEPDGDFEEKSIYILDSPFSK